MVSVCLPSDASCNTYHLTWVSLTLGVGYLFTAAPAKHSRCFLTLDEGYLLTATLPDLQRGIAPLGPPVPVQQPLLGRGLIFPAPAPGLGHRVAPPGSRPWPRTWGGSSQPPPLASDKGGFSGCSCAVAAWHSQPLPLTSDEG